MVKFLKLSKEYLVNILIAFKGGHVKRWQVFYIGELGVGQLSFSEFNFTPTPIIFMRAEKVPGRPDGQLNDAYNQMKLDEENRIAVYCKSLT